MSIISGNLPFIFRLCIGRQDNKYFD